MNSKTLILVALLPLTWVAQAAEMATFDEVRAQYQSYKDPTRVSYLYNRCAALQLNVSALLARKGQAKAAQAQADHLGLVVVPISDSWARIRVKVVYLSDAFSPLTKALVDHLAHQHKASVTALNPMNP